MPLYEYECQQCHRRTEKILKFSDPDLTVCPHCGGPLERTITAAAISFKGSGWYKDLYSSPKPAAASDSSGDAKPNSGDGGAATTDKPPASKAADAGASTATGSESAKPSAASAPGPSGPSTPAA